MAFSRVAIIHYWLVGMRGGERVLERLLRLYPSADLITHVYDPNSVSSLIRERKVLTTFIQNLPGSKKHYQKYLPLMPMALESLDLRGYDLIISSESGPAKGVIATPDAYHVCYCHSPMRYLWDHYHAYRARADAISRSLMPPVFHYLRMWDAASAARVDRFVANSAFIGKRIARAWGRESTVVHPPVQTELFERSRELNGRYLWVGQMVQYKRPDLVVDAFNKLQLPLTMIGGGELAGEIAKRAGPTITILPKLSFEELRRAYADCRALIFPAEEDFGIVPVEANASGRPVIAYRSGGATETIVDFKTGLFFDAQTVDSIIDAVERCEKWLPDFDPDAAVTNAQRFSAARFDEAMTKAVDGRRL